MPFALKTINGDLFSSKDALAHCVGADFRMGMGIAVKFRDFFGQVDYLKKQNVQKGGCAVLKATKPDRYIYYMVTKERSSGCYPTYESLESSLKAMRNHMIENNIPQIGCGLDRLQWPEVVDRLHRVFENDDVEITVYKYSPPK
ncbi:hypothetical protein PVAND_002481 [Polypedilum vanderplanki]|uniref:Macro domain-containing protein n=1 Tax=Polypedilum vanderplanki TaxID=319348 RepID=A0A9J6BR49_POLVA|nr:hypothetical protein PVAND_002481 [Polypedilum vanderplanki]